MTPEELVWVATVFDCEGCIAVQRKVYEKKNGQIVKKQYVSLVIGHCSLDLVTRFHSLVRMGTVKSYEYKSGTYSYERVNGGTSRYDYRNKKRVYWWRISRRAEVLKFMKLIWDEWISEYRRETARSLDIAPESDLNVDSAFIEQWLKERGIL